MGVRLDRKTWIALGMSFVLTWVLMKWILLFEAKMDFSYFLSTWFLTWVPGCIGLIAAKNEKIKIPILSEPIPILFCSFLIAWLLGICTAFQSDSFSSDHLFIKLFIFYPACSLLNMIHVCGLAIFWWGYLYKKLEQLHPFIALLIIGISCGLWYAPLIMMESGYCKEHCLETLVKITLLVIVASPLMFYLRRKGKNIFAPALFFSTLTMSEILRNDFQDSLVEGVIGFRGITMLFVCSCITIMLLWKQGALAREQKQKTE